MKNKSSFLFVSINIIVAAIGFLRSFVFMNIFELKELGIVTLINTATVLIGFFQLGIINGAYRLVALNDSDKSIKTNNVVFSYFGVVFIIISFLTIISIYFGITQDFFLGVSVIVLGCLTLINNWLTNYMIGSLNLEKLNIANFVSAIISILFSITTYYLGIYGAILSLISQPLFFIIVALIINKGLAPNKFDLDIKYIKSILELGFIPFLTGVFFLFYMQIERWTINLILGPEELGKLFLFFIVVNLWTLIPTSISNLFFPKVIKSFSQNELMIFKIYIRDYSLIVLFYCLIGGVAILFLLKPIVTNLFPNHSAFSNFVVLSIPGLFFRTIADPLALFFNSVLKLNIIFWSEFLALIAYILFIYYGKQKDLLNLNYFIYAFDFYFIFKYVLFFVKYNFVKNNYY